MNVVTIGELMLRLTPPRHERFVQAESFEAVYGGGEANTAVSLSCLGDQAVFVTKLPAHAVGQAAVDALRRYGVDTRHIVRGGERIGIYFMERGADRRPSDIIYDRAHSAFAESSEEEYDWPAIFAHADWLHLTGITPALSPVLSGITLEAAKAAKEMGLTVSCDLNFRKKLWSRDQARDAMTAICGYVDVLIANEEDAKDVFGIEAAGSDIESGKLSREGYVSVAEQLSNKFGFKAVAITLRESLSASDNNWSAMLYMDGTPHFSKKYAVHIVDRVGGGDSFGAGLIYALLSGDSPSDALEFAVAASCLKHSVEGDYNMVSAEEVRALARGNASGRVQR